jgi:hypothetical protein
MFESPECRRDCESDNKRYDWVAEHDWRAHPEDWPRDKFPASKNYADDMSGIEPCPTRARRRVLHGIKAL